MHEHSNPFGVRRDTETVPGLHPPCTCLRQNRSHGQKNSRVPRVRSELRNDLEDEQAEAWIWLVEDPDSSRVVHEKRSISNLNDRRQTDRNSSTWPVFLWKLEASNSSAGWHRLETPT
jgi:hypothetical protein